MIPCWWLLPSYQKRLSLTESHIKTWSLGASEMLVIFPICNGQNNPIIDMLISLGADATIKNGYGKTPKGIERLIW